tara:strand:+ start:973 stop:1326 length:354 start_codon:yes stop_codon:yes gene_type:complete
MNKRLETFTTLATVCHILYYFKLVNIPNTYYLALFVFIVGQILIHRDVIVGHGDLFVFMNSCIIHIIPLLYIQKPKDPTNSIVFTLILLLSWTMIIGLEKALDIYIFKGITKYITEK